MNKSAVVVIVGILCLLLSACSARMQSGDFLLNQNAPTASTSALQELPADYEPIRLAWFYKPPASGNMEVLVENYDLFILTRQDEQERDTITGNQGDIDVLQYLLFGAIMDPGSCTDQPWHNQVAENVGDFCEIEMNHPDWFLHGVGGNLLSNDHGYVLMDPANPGWRDFWIERADRGHEVHGWNGVFLDNVEASLHKRYLTGLIPVDYSTDSAYQEAVEDNLRYLYESYFQPNELPLYANIISLTDPSAWYRYVQYLDGAMIENFAVGWSRGDESPSEWEMHLSLAEDTQAMGKDIILVSQGEAFDHERETFALASYLLVNNGRAFFRYTHQDNYDLHWWYDNYTLDLGVPLDNRYQKGDTWVRDFTNGRVVVHPAIWQAVIEVNEP